MAEPEDTEEEEEEEEDDEDEDEEEREEEEKRMPDDRRDDHGRGRDDRRDDRRNNRRDGRSREKNWKNAGLRHSWLKTIGPETVRFGMSRLAAALVRRGMKTEQAERIKALLATQLGDSGVKNFLIPILQITGNVPPAFRNQLVTWGLPHDSVDILNDALNDVFEAAYLEYDAVGTPAAAAATVPLKEPTFQDAVNQLDMRQGLALDRIIQRIKADPESSKKFEAFRSKLTQRRDLEMIIAFVAEHALGDDAPPADIVAFIERRCGELPKPAPAKTFASRFGAVGKLAAELLPTSGSIVTDSSATSSLAPLYQTVSDARWADAKPIVPAGQPSGFMAWLRSTRFYNYFFDPPAPPAPPTAPGGAAPGP